MPNDLRVLDFERNLDARLEARLDLVRERVPDVVSW